MFETAQQDAGVADYTDTMSALNGDRARFHKDRKRKLHHRQRIQALAARLRKPAEEQTSSRVASGSLHDEGGPGLLTPSLPRMVRAELSS